MLPLQVRLDLVPAIADRLHGLADGILGDAFLFGLVTNLMLLAARNACAILRATSCRCRHETNLLLIVVLERGAIQVVPIDCNVGVHVDARRLISHLRPHVEEEQK